MNIAMPGDDQNITVKMGEDSLARREVTVRYS
jgi:hypothetical protein